MNDKKPITTFTLTLQPYKPVGHIYVTLNIDPSVEIENKLSKMVEYKEAKEILSNIANKGKEF